MAVGPGLTCPREPPDRTRMLAPCLGRAHVLAGELAAGVLPTWLSSRVAVVLVRIGFVSWVDRTEVLAGLQVSASPRPAASGV